MVDEKDASLVLERRPSAATGRPGGLDGVGEGRFELAVVFTSFDATTAALKMAGTLASGLDAHITLVVAQTVPYPLPLENPPVLLDFLRPRIWEIVRDSPVETTILHYLCRDRLLTVSTVLKSCSIVVVGARKKWWPTREKVLAWRLRRVGHRVIVTETT